MRKHPLNAIRLILALLACLTVASLPVMAQEPPVTENDQTLKDIFEGDATKTPDNRAKSGKEMAYEYYEKCSTSPDFFVTEKTQKNYCACKAAKMEETMTPKEMAALEENTRAGDSARDKMRMNADANCMRDPILSYTYGICMKDTHFREIVIGKGTLCRCVREFVARRTRRDLPDIIIKSSTQEPLSTDSLSFFLRSPDFDQHYMQSKDYCYTKFIYEQTKN